MASPSSTDFKKEARFYLTTVFSLTSAFTLYQAVQLQRKINKVRRRIEFVENQDVYSPTELHREVREVLAVGYDSDNHKKFKPVYDATSKKLVGLTGEVLLRGRVEPNGDDRGFETITNGGLLYSKRIETVARIRFQEEIYSNDASDPSRGRYIIDLHRILKNCQMDYRKQFAVGDQKSQVAIANYDKINFEKALEITNFKQSRRTMMPHEFLFTLVVLGVKMLAELLFKNVDVSTFRGISVGLRDTEVGIRIGSGIAVIGQFIYDVEKGTLRIDKPELILSERLSFLNELKRQLEDLISNRNTMLLIGVATGLYAGRQAFKYLKRTKRLPSWIAEYLQ